MSPILFPPILFPPILFLTYPVPGCHLSCSSPILFQQPAGAKADGGEITAAAPLLLLLLLEKLVLQGKLITGDAIFAQRSLCQQITDGQGDYLVRMP